MSEPRVAESCPVYGTDGLFSPGTVGTAAPTVGLAAWGPLHTQAFSSSILSAAWYPSASLANPGTLCYVVGISDAPVRLVDGLTGKVRGIIKLGRLKLIAHRADSRQLSHNRPHRAISRAVQHGFQPGLREVRKIICKRTPRSCNTPTSGCTADTTRLSRFLTSTFPARRRRG